MAPKRERRSAPRYITWESSDEDLNIPHGFRVDYGNTVLTDTGYCAPLVRCTCDADTDEDCVCLNPFCADCGGDTSGTEPHTCKETANG